MPRHEITSGLKGGPYTAQPTGSPCLWYVENANGVNCLIIADAGRKTGSKFTNEVTARALADRWNREGGHGVEQ